MKRAIILILTACTITALGLHSFCSQPVSGGTGTETVNTFAKLPDGSPAVGAHVKLIDSHNWLDSIQADKSPVLAEGITDSKGFCSLAIQQKKQHLTIQIDHKTEGIVHPILCDDACTTDTLMLEKYASLSGSIISGSSAPNFLCLAGTDYRESTGSDNEFSFDRIPAGAFALLGISEVNKQFIVSSLTSVLLESGTPVTDISSGEMEDRVLIDNFEGEIGPTLLGSVIPGLGWYVLSDSLFYYWDTDYRQWTQGKATIMGQTPISYGPTVIDSNHAFTISAELDPKSVTANALLGLSLKSLNDDGIDLSTMSGVSFRAKGEGIVRVRFETNNLDKVNFKLSHFTFRVALNDTMTTYTIPVDSFEIVEPFVGDERYSWSRESEEVVRIHFSLSPFENKTGEELSFTLDDFYLEGITINDILKQREQ